MFVRIARHQKSEYWENNAKHKTEPEPCDGTKLRGTAACASKEQMLVTQCEVQDSTRALFLVQGYKSSRHQKADAGTARAKVQTEPELWSGTDPAQSYGVGDLRHPKSECW